MLKVLMCDVRVKSVIERAEKIGIDGYAIIEKIGSFDNVETFQTWKNGLDESNAFIVARLGRNNYLKVRNALRYND